MNGTPFTHRTPEEVAASEESLAGRDALVALVRMLARQAARDALTAPHVGKEDRDDQED